jgi:myo-inositol-1(or 4)-monophosphatase
MDERMQVVRKTVRAAGSFLIERFGREITGGVTEKKTNDFVTEVDRESERIITVALRDAFAGIGVYAEEGGVTGSTERFWIVDPLDGTTNFIHHYPVFSISIALYEEGKTVLGVVYDPTRDELFEAIRGGGAFCNGERIRVSDAALLTESLLGTGFPFSVPQYIDSYLAAFKELFLGCRGMRRAGSAALDLCHVAAGRLDGFWELYLKPWDMAAGALIVQEAGGAVTDFFGGGGYLSAGHVVAAPRLLLPRIIGVTGAHFSPSDLESIATPFPGVQ